MTAFFYYGQRRLIVRDHFLAPPKMKVRRRAVREPPLRRFSRPIQPVGPALPAELAAGRADLLAPTLPDEYRIIGGPQDGLELQDPFRRRWQEGQVGVLVEGDEVDLGLQAAQEPDKLAGVGRGVVEVSNQDVVEGDAAVRGQGKLRQAASRVSRG